jgi:hypothetical protein
MESGYHIVTIRVIRTSWAHVWRLRSLFLETGYDKGAQKISDENEGIDFTNKKRIPKYARGLKDEWKKRHRVS